MASASSPRGLPARDVGGDRAATSAARAVRTATALAAIRGERCISYCRLAFCTALLVRFVSLSVPLPPAAYVVNVTSLVAGIAFSSWVLRSSRARATAVALPLAPVVDAVLCFFSLLQTVLFSPLELGYRGLLTGPDAGIVPLLVFASAFRLSVRLAGIAGALNAVSLVAVLCIEHVRFGGALAYGNGELSMFTAIFVTSWAGSILLARQARALAETAASDSLRVETARRDMLELLRTQHDTRSLLAAASLHADLVCGALSQSGRTADPMPHRWAESLRSDLATANEWVQSFGERVFAGLSSIGEVEAVDTERVLPAALAVLATRFQGVKLETSLHALVPVRLAGGTASLQRILLNVLTNAVEGDGSRGARCVRVRTSLSERHLLLSVEDDGPGFCGASLPSPESAPAACLTTKRNGSGFGLYTISQILQSTGGYLKRRNVEGSGAVVTVALPIDALSAP
jgi:signal transduction histidine kinase